MYIFVNKYCIKHKDETNASIKQKTTAVKAVVLCLYAVTGLFLGNLMSIGITFHTALSHGIEKDEITGKYELTYGEMQTYNRYSIAETNVSVDELKGKAVIFVRYDCPTCILLHSELSSIDDVVFLSSRSETGKIARELYGINLTEVPQGAFIDNDGNATTISIVSHSNDSVSLDLHQVSILREMANLCESSSNE